MALTLFPKILSELVIMAYTKRTCHSCGFRDIQPNMKQETVQVKVGSSTTGMNKRTVAGAFLMGDKKSGAQIRKYLFAPNKRNYTRNRQVWVCKNCSKSNSSDSDDTASLILMIIGFCIVGWIFS